MPLTFHFRKANRSIARQPPVSTCMYRALFHQSGGRQKEMETVLLSQLLAVKKKKSQNHKNHKIQTAAHWLNYVNHSPKRSRWSILVWNPIRTHTFLKKTATTQLLLSNWKLQAILSMKKWLQVVHLYTVFRQMKLVLKPKNLPFQLHVEIMACFFQHTL